MPRVGGGADRNNGAAGFTRVAGAFPTGTGYSQMTFADIDEDGDLDLYTGAATNTLLTNDGTGVFTDAVAHATTDEPDA